MQVVGVAVEFNNANWTTPSGNRHLPERVPPLDSAVESLPTNPIDSNDAPIVANIVDVVVSRLVVPSGA